MTASNTIAYALFMFIWVVLYVVIFIRSANDKLSYSIKNPDIVREIISAIVALIVTLLLHVVFDFNEIGERMVQKINRNGGINVQENKTNIKGPVYYRGERHRNHDFIDRGQYINKPKTYNL